MAATQLRSKQIVGRADLNRRVPTARQAFGRVVSRLEGGDALGALGRSVAADVMVPIRAD